VIGPAGVAARSCHSNLLVANKQKVRWGCCVLPGGWRDHAAITAAAPPALPGGPHSADLGQLAGRLFWQPSHGKGAKEARLRPGLPRRAYQAVHVMQRDPCCRITPHHTTPQRSGVHPVRL
jgi:hypothetical protein